MRKVDQFDRLTRDADVIVCEDCWSRLGTAHARGCRQLGVSELVDAAPSPLARVADDAEAEWYGAG